MSARGGTPATQLTIGLPALERLTRADFLAAPANEAALAFIEAWPQWPAPVLVIHGPAGAGKTHLAAIWHARAAPLVLSPQSLRAEPPRSLVGRATAVLLEDIDRDLPATDLEEPLFSLWTAMVERRGHLLLTARMPVARWPIAMPDLTSRLRSATAVAVSAPDESLLELLLVKLLSDRQLRVAPDVLRFAVPRLERTFQAARDFVERLDRLALAQRREISVPLARAALAPQEPGES